MTWRALVVTVPSLLVAASVAWRWRTRALVDSGARVVRSSPADLAVLATAAGVAVAIFGGGCRRRRRSVDVRRDPDLQPPRAGVVASLIHRALGLDRASDLTFGVCFALAFLLVRWASLIDSMLWSGVMLLTASAASLRSRASGGAVTAGVLRPCRPHSQERHGTIGKSLNRCGRCSPARSVCRSSPACWWCTPGRSGQVSRRCCRSRRSIRGTCFAASTCGWTHRRLASLCARAVRRRWAQWPSRRSAHGGPSFRPIRTTATSHSLDDWSSCSSSRVARPASRRPSASPMSRWPAG